MTTPTVERQHIDLRAPLLLAGWTFLVWTTRIRNIWTDDQLTVAGQVGRTLLALSFTVLAGAVVGVWLGGRRRGAPRIDAAVVVRVFAGWTTAVWVVRSAQIALADHGAAFIVVHIALAIVSIALAGFAVRSVRSASVGQRSG